MTKPGAIDLEMLRGCGPPALKADSDKEDRGRLLVVAGGAQVAGAAILVGVAGLRVGAGKLQMAATAALAPALALAMPEARILEVPAVAGEIAGEAAERLAPQLAATDAVVIGPGMMEDAVAGELALRALQAADAAAFVIDAAALTGLAERTEDVRRAGGRLVVTPHAGEMAALTGAARREVENDPLRMARETARRLQAVVVMKGAETFVVTPDGAAWRHRAALPGLGASGSGDVLAGVIGGMLARGCSPLGAAAWGVWLHARAGARLTERIGPLGFLARELPDELPAALQEAAG
ncbi:NAD(P)H-hydrate dehydratase [Phenylobacterium soli]|uniref:NAD(P)H-hydrate dehydratase n=1 Tax=Phenylobacterium soli TaxID=2170551 RepID=UPI001D03EF24|nr:NAD(P)H-hydrate dehydratase [Phenylobacterium soli]